MADQTQRQIPIVCPGHSRPLAALEFSNVTPDGVFLISACHDKEPMLRNGETGDWIGTFKGHKGAVWAAKLDDGAMRAVTGSGDFSARVWDATTGSELHSFSHSHIVKTVDFSPDGSRFVSGGHEGIVRVYDLNNTAAPPTQVKLQPKAVITKAIWTKTDNHRVVTGSGDGMIRAWDLRTGTEVQTAEVQGTVMDMEASRGENILTVSAGKQVTFFDFATLSLIKAYEMPMHFKDEGGASLHPEGRRFIAGGSDLWVRVFDYETGAELECHKGHHGPVRCLRYAPEGRQYATGSEDGTIRIWQTELQA